MNDAEIVSLDTMTIIWGVSDRERIRKGEYKQGEEDKANRSIHLIDHLDSSDVVVTISTVTIAEVLAGCSEANHAAIIDILEKRFEILPFEVDAARLSARLYRKYMPELRVGGASRDVVKNDLDIIASSYTFGSRCFYTCDTRARKIAVELGMPAPELPQHPKFLFPMNSLDPPPEENS